VMLSHGIYDSYLPTSRFSIHQQIRPVFFAIKTAPVSRHRLSFIPSSRNYAPAITSGIYHIRRDQEERRRCRHSVL
jgi:hypothetical protein